MKKSRSDDPKRKLSDSPLRLSATRRKSVDDTKRSLSSSPRRLTQSLKGAFRKSPVRLTPTHTPRASKSIYYHFMNHTTQQLSDKGPPPNFLPYVEKLYNYTYIELHELFVYVIRENGWAQSDVIYAFGDEGDKVMWSDYSIT